MIARRARRIIGTTLIDVLQGTTDDDVYRYGTTQEKRNDHRGPVRSYWYLV